MLNVAVAPMPLSAPEVPSPAHVATAHTGGAALALPEPLPELLAELLAELLPEALPEPLPDPLPDPLPLIPVPPESPPPPPPPQADSNAAASSANAVPMKWRRFKPKGSVDGFEAVAAWAEGVSWLPGWLVLPAPMVWLG